MAPSSANTLWQRAIETLSKEDRRSLDVDEGEDLDISGLLADIDAKKQECIAKRWKFKKGDREVIIRDQLEKIIVWVNKFKEVGDVAMQYDPSHAALPWACVRFLLQAAVNDSQIFGAMVDGVERVANVITKHAIVEKLYLQENPIIIGDQLSQSIVKLYSAILAYLSEAKRYYSQNSAVRMAKSVLSVKESSIERSLSNISEEEECVNGYTRLISREGDQHMSEDINMLKEILSQLGRPINRSAAQLSDLHDCLKREERLEIFRWMSTVPHRSHHENTGNDFLPQSGQWLLQKREFIEWRQSSVSSILWLHGIPGSGKSKIVYSVIEHLRQEGSALSAPAPIAYFYCARNQAEPLRADPTEVLRSILKQLCSSKANLPIRLPIVEKFKTKKEAADEDGSDPSRLKITECINLILAVLENDPATIIIDALDECDSVRRHELLEALDEIIQKSSSLVQFFVSSRDSGDIVTRLIHSPNIYISIDDNKDDIKRFIDDKISLSIERKNLLNGRVPASLKNQIILSLEKGAQGMFRWVDLQIQNLCDPERIKHENDIRQELGRLPESLKALYKIVYERVMRSAPTSQSTAEKTMKWLLGAKCPLRTHELIAAVSVDNKGRILKISTEELLDMCCNLITVDSELDIFRFAHLSVKEYLEQDRPEFSVLEIDALITERCIDTYTHASRSKRLSVGEGNDAVSKQNCILKSYATIYWPFHYRNIEREDLQDQCKEKIREFLFYDGQATEPFATWMQDTYKVSETLRWDHPLRESLRASLSSPPTPLFLACQFGLSTVLEELIPSESFDCNKRNNDGTPGLSLAVLQRHKDVVRLLLASGANIEASNDIGDTALHQAAACGDEDMVQLLLLSGANVAALDPRGSTALHMAAAHGHEVVVQLLLTSGANVAALDRYGHTALQHAITRRNKTMVQLLLRSGASVAALDCERAAARGDEAMVRLLQASRANAIARDSYRMTNLHDAAYRGEEDLVRLLLESGANVAALDRDGRTALHMAAIRGHGAVVQLLLTSGANVEALDQHGETALHIAATFGHELVVQLLLTSGANIEALDQHGETALHIAVACGHEIVVQLLVTSGANAAALDQHGETALHIAVACGHEKVVTTLQMLRWADWVARDRDRSIALHIAASRGNKAMVRLLLAGGADIAAQDRDGSTALYKAAAYGHEAVVRLLLTSGANFEALNQHGSTALHKAAACGHEAVVRLLLTSGANIEALNQYGSTALHEAAAYGYEAVVRLLLTSGANIEALNQHGSTALHKAAACGHEAVVQLLLAGGADIAAQDRVGSTVLHIAAARGHEAVVRLLLESGASVGALDSQGFTALDRAAQAEQKTVVRLLQGV
ncbi:MAG: hypothetical protein M1824_001230 [Vezdaea acicularis]|nr:MAG: hypothetical protein M1824_001230 [Vezdaea acicularis]